MVMHAVWVSARRENTVEDILIIVWGGMDRGGEGEENRVTRVWMLSA